MDRYRHCGDLIKLAVSCGEPTGAAMRQPVTSLLSTPRWHVYTRVFISKHLSVETSWIYRIGQGS